MLMISLPDYTGNTDMALIDTGASTVVNIIFMTLGLIVKDKVKDHFSFCIKFPHKKRMRYSVLRKTYTEPN